MKLSIITTITNPTLNQYAWREAIENYLELADEVIVVNGGKKLIHSLLPKNLFNNIVSNKLKIIDVPWPKQWHWSELPVHLNAGLEAATGDWVIKTDIDYFFHDKDFSSIRYALENPAKNYMVASFVKRVIVNKHGLYRKVNLPIAINKAMVSDTIKFGIDFNEKSDWCMPILVNNYPQSFDIGDKINDVPVGRLVTPPMIYETEIDVWNYDSIFRTKDKQKEVFWRFAQAYATAFDKSWGTTPKQAFQYWVNMMKGRIDRKLHPIGLESHPKHIQERIKNLKPEQWGFNNWNGLMGHKILKDKDIKKL